MRAALRGEEPENKEIPWYPWDDAEEIAPADAAPPAPVLTPRENLEREQPTTRDSVIRDRSRRTTTASTSGEDDSQRVSVVSEEVQIHAPPTSTVTVSAPITTVASSAMTTATMVTPPGAFAGGTRAP